MGHQHTLGATRLGVVGLEYLGLSLAVESRKLHDTGQAAIHTIDRFSTANFPRASYLAKTVEVDYRPIGAIADEAFLSNNYAR